VWNNEKSLEKLGMLSNHSDLPATANISTGFPLSARNGAFSHRGTVTSTTSKGYNAKAILELQDFDPIDSSYESTGSVDLLAA